MPSAIRHNVFTNLARRYKPLMLSAVANNPHASAAVLNRIIKIPSGTGDPAIYAKSSTGLAAALAAASSGDAIYIPPGTISGNHTIASGVEVIGIGKNTILSGAITNNGVMSNLRVASGGTVTVTGSLRMVEDLNRLTQYWQGDSGQGNIALGYQAGEDFANTAWANIAIGYQAGKSITVGQENVVIGTGAAPALTTGSNNVFIGDAAVSTGVVTGDQNIAIGAAALLVLTTGHENVVIGYAAADKLTTGYNNVIIGFNAAGGVASNTTGYDNVIVGRGSGDDITSGYRNAMVGADSGAKLTSGSDNVMVGQAAGFSVTDGENNTFVGESSGYGMTTGDFNTVIGTWDISDLVPGPTTTIGITTGSENTIVGSRIIGLSSTLANTVILADGAGDIRFYSEADGDTGLNTAAPLAQVHIDQDETDAAQPVLLLDQADVDEPFIKVVGTAASADLTRSIVAVGDVSTATLAGYVKIEVEDIGNQITDQDYFLPVYTLA